MTARGHSVGTAAPAAVVPQGRAGRAPDWRSGDLPGWPRLLSEAQACAYLNLSRDTLLGYVYGGALRVVRPARPDTARAHGYRGGNSRRTVTSDTLRRRLFDRVDLDELVERWKRERVP